MILNLRKNAPPPSPTAEKKLVAYNIKYTTLN